MIRALLEKELRQHAGTFAFLFALLLISLAAIRVNVHRLTVNGTAVEGMRFLLFSHLPLACLMLGHVLIATEFGRKTQLFLDALPLPRWRLLAIKYLLGLLLLAISCAAGLAIDIWSLNKTGAVTAQFALILGAKTALWLLFIYSFFFVHSLLGRYRIPAAVGIFVLVTHLQQQGFSVWKSAPFQLIDQRFAYEAHLLPVRELWITLGVSLGLVAFGFWLGLARDASLTGLLANRMSGREKVFFTFITVAAFMAIPFTAERRRQLEVVHMPGAIEVDKGVAHVTASIAADSPSSAEQAAVQRIGSRVASELEQLADYLGSETLPPLFIVHRRDFRPDQIENGGLKAKQGLMLRANVAAEAFSEKEFLRRLIHDILMLKSSGRAAMERNAWVLDGFPDWWLERRQRESPGSSETPVPDLQTIDFSQASIKRWFEFRKNNGDGKAKEVARVGIATVESRLGSAACRAFLSAMLAEDIPKDFRGWLGDATNPMPRRFRTATGVPLESFSLGWKAALLSGSETLPRTE